MPCVRLKEMKTIYLALIVVFLSGCGFEVGIPINQSYVKKKPFGTPAEWRPTRIDLTNGYVANVGPYFYQDETNDIPDYYSIDIEKREGNAWPVYFSVDMPLDWVSSNKLTASAKEIVSFNPQTGIVIFDVGTTSFTYRLKEGEPTL